MELRVLRYFLTVVREQSFSAAAEKLHLTQPTLSRQIMELERELGTQLIVRGGKGRRIGLTEQGQLLRRRAEELLELSEKTQQEIRGWNQKTAGDVFIGGGETEAMRLVARTAVRLQKEYPGIRYHLHSGNLEQAAYRLDKGLLDFALVVGEADLTKYEFLRLPYQDIWGLLLRRDHPLAEKSSVTKQDLEGLPLLISRQTLVHTNSEVSLWYGTSLDNLPLVGTYNLIHNAALLVEEGFGCALTIDKLVHAVGPHTLKFIPLEPKVGAGVNLVWKKSQVFSPAAQLFLDRFRRDLQQLKHEKDGETVYFFPADMLK